MPRGFSFFSEEYMRTKCYDGYLVKTMDPVVFLMPYIMPRRCDSECKVNMELDLTNTTKFIKEHRDDIPGLTLYHMVFAAVVRACALNPEINRFITKNRLYQRKHVRISMMIKKHLAVDGRETCIYPTFEVTDSLAEIVKKTNTMAEEALAKMDDDSNSFDKLTGILCKVPPFIVGGFVKLMMFLDRNGWLPKALVDMQPFHSGFFVTNVGSIGLPNIYHHLYEFGTTSMFLGIGTKETVQKVNAAGDSKITRTINIKAVVDDRICDGFSYSCAFKTLKKCFEHPEILLEGYKKDKQ